MPGLCGTLADPPKNMTARDRLRWYAYWPKRVFSRNPRDRDPRFIRPGEKMPRLKYRRTPDPEHKAALEAWTWEAAWSDKPPELRYSPHGDCYSPMGTRLPTPPTSIIGVELEEEKKEEEEEERKEEEEEEKEDMGVEVDSGIGSLD
ncbi:uncharacterized protein EI97DRAFT_314048 [Westerdykella ornata]|uniref:Uncharacterized protein n=1 Tax=Westerdykella ornata TaxID=318751 RepID=A0A6A6JL65_WESOR|nr:uncharacterized protein EI97DRAFT_314048 [Westerdykella ornata]KAF2277232.1 hypothetical protein EI97DRAFT_314048 [Westerdykella ornata]